MNPTRRSLLAGLGAGAVSIAGCAAPTQRSREGADSDYTRIYRDVADAVVEVHVSDGQQAVGQGSGFLVDDETIVTNHHVVDVGPDISVQFSTREWVEVSLLGSDPHSDIAVLSVDDDAELPDPLSFVDESPPIGEEILAIGSPFDLSGSLSRGIISGRNRSIPGPGTYQVPDTIQTDAALNPGSSGGPIVDLSGAVVGIVIANQGQTVGFAISAALAKRVVPALRETGRYEHSRLGVSITEVGPELAAANDLAEPGGLLVVDVDPDGPADGILQSSVDEPVDADSPNASDTQLPPNGSESEPSIPTGGDVIVGLDGTPISDSDHLASVLALDTSPGETIPVTVRRDGETVTVEVTLGSRPTE